MMQVRGFLFLLAAPVFWMLYAYAFEKARNSQFGYEIGSVAAPIPPPLDAFRLLAFVCVGIGVSLVILDFIKWRKTRSHDE